MIQLSDEKRLELLEAGEQVAKLGSWERFPGLDQQLWSDNLYRIFGFEPGEITPTREFVLERTHPDDRERVAAYLATIPPIAHPPPIEYRIVQPGGQVRHLLSTLTPIESGARGARRILGAVQDVTEQLLADREIAAHVAVSRALAEWQSLQESGTHLLSTFAKAMEFAFGALWLPEGDVLAARLLWNDSSLIMTKFEAATLELRLRRGVGLPGRVWEFQAPMNITDLRADPDSPRREASTATGLHGAVAFPALHAGEVLAVLEFYYREQCPPTERSMHTMRAIGYELGEFLSRRQGQLHPAVLTPRELEVLQLAADGNTGPRIAGQLAVSAETIGTHMKHIFERLGVSDRAAAVAAAIRLGLIE